MSIIYDALKKVQKNIGNENPPQAGAPPSPKAKIKIRPLLVFILFICLGLAAANYAYIYFSRSKNIIRHPPKEPALTPAPKPAVATTAAATAATPAPPIPPEPTLVLNGVFFEQGDGYALINNKILRLGDMVGSAKVKEITMSGVELEYEGKTIKLASPS